MSGTSTVSLGGLARTQVQVSAVHTASDGTVTRVAVNGRAVGPNEDAVAYFAGVAFPSDPTYGPSSTKASIPATRENIERIASPPASETTPQQTGQDVKLEQQVTAQTASGEAPADRQQALILRQQMAAQNLATAGQTQQHILSAHA